MNVCDVGTICFIGGSMSGAEIMIILVALLLLFGSKNLPSIARNIGKSLETFRRTSREVTDEIMRADLDKDPPPMKSSRREITTAEIGATEPHAEPKPEPQPDLEVKPSAQSVERDEQSRT